MAERRERRKAVRVAISGTQVLRTHADLKAHLFDLSLGGRVAHFGLLRPGALCFVQLPADVSAVLRPVRVLWCVIRGTEWRSDGERHLRCHSGLQFTTPSVAQQTVLAGYFQKARSGDPARRESQLWSAGSSLDHLHLIQRPGEDAARRTGTNRRDGNGTHAGLVVISSGRPLGERPGPKRDDSAQH